jgi:hypothetical protein
MTEEQQVIEAADVGRLEEVVETPSVLDTPELKQPARPPDAHRGRIESVVLTDPNDNGNRAIHITLTSLDTGQLDETDIWLPKDFVENINIDPETLSTGEKDPVTGDVIEANQRGSYGMGISNSDKDATLQTLRILAAQVGLALPVDEKVPTNIEEYVDSHAKLLTGLELVYTRTRPSKKRQAENPQFKNVLRVNRFFPIEGTVGNPKVLKKYRKAWDEEAA